MHNPIIPEERWFCSRDIFYHKHKIYHAYQKGTPFIKRKFIEKNTLEKVKCTPGQHKERKKSNHHIGMSVENLRLQRKAEDTEPGTLPAIVNPLDRLQRSPKQLRQRVWRQPGRSRIHAISIIISGCPVHKRKIKNRKHKQERNSCTCQSDKFYRQPSANFEI